MAFIPISLIISRAAASSTTSFPGHAHVPRPYPPPVYPGGSHPSSGALATQNLSQHQSHFLLGPRLQAWLCDSPWSPWAGKTCFFVFQALVTTPSLHRPEPRPADTRLLSGLMGSWGLQENFSSRQTALWFWVGREDVREKTGRALSLQPLHGQPRVHHCGPACSFRTQSLRPAPRKAAPLTCIPCSYLLPPPAPTPPNPRIATASPLHTPPPAPAPPDPIATASPLHTLPPGLPLQSVQLPILPTPRVVPVTLGQLTRSQPRTSLLGPLPPCQAILPALCIPVCPEALRSGSPRAIRPRRSQEGAGGQGSRDHG